LKRRQAGLAPEVKVPNSKLGSVSNISERCIWRGNVRFARSISLALSLASGDAVNVCWGGDWAGVSSRAGWCATTGVTLLLGGCVALSRGVGTA
jgi:hypothetical protein